MGVCWVECKCEEKGEKGGLFVCVLCEFGCDCACLQQLTPFTGLPTRLKGTTVFVNTRQDTRFWFPDRNNANVSAMSAERDIQAAGDTRLSLQGIQGVLFPTNVSRLLPPSLVAQPRNTRNPPPPRGNDSSLFPSLYAYMHVQGREEKE